jgi:hypothetical protein
MLVVVGEVNLMNSHKDNEAREQLHAVELSDEVLGTVMGGHGGDENHNYGWRNWNDEHNSDYGRSHDRDERGHERNWHWYHRHHGGRFGGLV